jgi:uncharacterized protein (DUF1800 family)
MRRSAASPEPPSLRRACLLPASLLLAALLLAPSWAHGADEVAPDEAQNGRIRHLLRRTTFGVRSADVEEVKRLGVEAWLERQLEPDAIPDREVEDRLKGYESLKLTGAEYWKMLEERAPREGPPGPGEDRIAAAQRRQAELNRLREMAAREVPASVLVRAVYSQRQLQEVMLEFWRNHFNVDVTKDDVRYYVAEWEGQVLRKHLWGSFEDLLMATAKHPAMLFYLDNHVSQAPLARADRVLRGRDAGRTNGLNENYARELMELHTVGVDNGYDQDDVIQLALVLTGWSIGGGAERGTFTFREAYHARGPKKVMGKTVKGEGLDEGEDMVRFLAAHKNTRQFVCTKLVRFLVADDPPEAIVKAAVDAWGKSKGSLRDVTRAILTHPDFYAAKHVATKAKTPFEFVASALRVTGADVQRPDAVMGRLADMYQDLYRCEDPTGYSDRAVDWMDPGVLAVRWQFAADLLHGRLAGVKVDQSPLLAESRQNPEVWEYVLIDGLLAGQQPGTLTMAPFRKRVNDVRREARTMRPQERQREFQVLATLLLGAPEFQRQ